MSDLSGQCRWEACSPEAFPASHLGQAEPLPAARQELRVNELRFRRLSSAGEIAEILPLRRTIPLPAAAQADPGFDEIEKKGMSLAWSERSSTTAGSLAQCAPFR
jgi:hypothetical protein